MVHPFFRKILLKSALLVLCLGGLGMNEVSAVAPRISKGQIARQILGAPGRVVRKLAKGPANKLGLRTKSVNKKAANQATNNLKKQQGRDGFPELS